MIGHGLSPFFALAGCFFDGGKGPSPPVKSFKIDAAFPRLKYMGRACFCPDFVQDNLEEATLYRLYCEPTRGRIARNQKEAFRTPGISPL